MSDLYTETTVKINTGNLAGLVPPALKVPVINRNCKTQGNNILAKERVAKSDAPYHQVIKNQCHLSLKQKEVVL